MPNLNPNYDEKGLAGYGIGLPVSKAYAEYMGGSLEIKSMDGIGSGMFIPKTLHIYDLFNGPYID